jgi:crotonobetainyl-CoA:carnitine CoA-transferase CaiB-like acyl-CoA transferase
MQQSILSGLKVIDCASFIAAPAAATILSDFGADVIKIEPPGEGDPYRKLSSMPGYPQSAHNYCWLLESRNKRSLALDLSKADGRSVLHRLLAETDIFITNYPFPVRKRLGIGYDALAPLNPRMIYASFSGYGEVGDEANKPGFDSNAYWARSGLMDIVRPDARSAPARSVAGMGDHPSALALFSAIVLALYQRERTGRGTQVGTSLIANGVWANGCWAQASLCGATFTERPPREEALNALANHYRCADDRWLMLSLLNEERQWPVLARAIGREDLIADERFATKSARYSHARELTTLLDEIFATKNLAEWRAILDASGLVFGFAATVDDIPNDRQMLENDVLVPFEGDGMLTVNSPMWVGGAEKVRPRKAPDRVGQHSDEVLREFGYDDAAIRQLRAGNIVA